VPKLTPAQQLAQLKAIKNPTPAQIQEIQVLESPLANPTTGYGALPGAVSGGTANLQPGVTKSKSGALINFALPEQKTPIPSASLLPTTTAQVGAQSMEQMTYANWMQQIANMSSDSAAVDQIQTQLKAAGYLTTKFSPGTVDAATKRAWGLLGTDANANGISAMTLLYSGANAPLLKQDLTDVISKINTAQTMAASASSSNVTLTDPNKVAQTFATAMESMGMGTPTPAQSQQFVNAFISGPQGEIAAEANQVNAAKRNDLNGGAQLSSELQTLEKGGINAYNNLNSGMGVTGPTSVATKAQPNLDAEAIASAKSIDPSMYYATQSTDLYGMIQQMLSGGLQQPTAPASPTSQAASGGILTTPLTGAP